MVPDFAKAVLSSQNNNEMIQQFKSFISDKNISGQAMIEEQMISLTVEGV